MSRERGADALVTLCLRVDALELQVQEFETAKGHLGHPKLDFLFCSFSLKTKTI